MKTKHQILMAVLVALAASPFIYLGVSYQPKPKTQPKQAQEATLKPICHDEMMAIAPEGKSVLKLPEGWHYIGSMDGVILVKREVCEGYR